MSERVCARVRERQIGRQTDRQRKAGEKRGNRSRLKECVRAQKQEDAREYARETYASFLQAVLT